MAWQLEDADYRVLVQVWDFVPGSNWAVGMQQGVVHAQRTVALLSHAYLRSVYGQAEWQAVQAADPLGFARRLLPIRLEDCPRPGLLGQIVSIDLFDRPAEAAREHLLDTIAAALAGRAKPAAAPAFPARSPPQRARASSAPAFPASPPAGSAARWPVVEGEPPMLATAFQERPGVQRRLAAALAQAGSITVVTQVLAGDGGIGKTQLAAKTFEQAQTSGSNDLCLWVTATSRQAIVTGYAHAMARIDPGARAEDPDRAARRFLTWLRETDRSWFIVFDDVADPADATGWWPSGQHGRTVVTTRRQDAVLSEHGRTLIDLGVFEPTESRDYLAGRLSTHQAHPNVLDGADDLADALGQLPLALAQAAAVILDDGLTCTQYLDRFRDRSKRLTDLFPYPLDERQRTVAATWSLATQAADRLSPEGCSRPLLAVIAVLDPNGIPENVILTTKGVRAFVTAQIAPATGEISIEQQRAALRALHRLSLIAHDPADPTRSIRMHALAQRATREALDISALHASYRAAADALTEAWQFVERDGDLSGVFRQNTATLAERAGDCLWAPQGHPVLFRAGHSMGEAGLVSQAVMYWRQLSATSLRVLGADHRDTLTARHYLAYWQGEAGDAAGAATGFEQLLSDQLRVLGADHPDTLTTRHELAYWQGWVGDVHGAAAAFEHLLPDRLRVLGPDHPETLATRHQLAFWLGKAGDPAGSAAAFAQLLPDRLRVLGPDHPEALSTRHNLARSRGEAGDVSGAVAECERLLSDRLRVLGPAHPKTLATRYELAYWQGHAGDPAGAAAVFEALAHDQLRVLGPDHPDTLATRHSLARCRGEAGNAAGAAAAFEALAHDQLRVLGPDHPETLATRHELARWRGEAGDTAGAAAAFEALARDQLRVLGPDHPETLATRHELARWRG